LVSGIGRPAGLAPKVRLTGLEFRFARPFCGNNRFCVFTTTIFPLFFKHLGDAELRVTRLPVV